MKRTIEKVAVNCARCAMPCDKRRAEIWVEREVGSNLLVGRYVGCGGEVRYVAGTAEGICAVTCGVGLE